MNLRVVLRRCALPSAGAVAEAPPVVPPWGGRNVRLRTPDGMQLTLFSEV